MPKGHAAIHWTAENDSKLFLTVLAVHNIQINYVSVAKAFGNVPASCIQTRIQRLKKMANGLGGASGSSGPAKRSVKGPINKKRKIVKTESDEDDAGVVTLSSSDDDEEGVEKPITPPMSAKSTTKTKTVSTKSRVSPRSSGKKKDYKTLGDPFVAFENTLDSNGEKIFNRDRSLSEDSAASDGEFRELTTAI